MPLKIVNETRWNIWDLRKFVLACMRAKGCSDKNYHVEFKDSTGKIVNGQADLGSPFITMWLPKFIRHLEFAQTLEHEIDHTLGIDHDEMMEQDDIRPQWYQEITIRKNKPKRKPAPWQRAGSRELHARQKLTEVRGKWKRARTVYLKWRKRVAYYDRKIAAQAFYEGGPSTGKQSGPPEGSGGGDVV